MRTDSPLLAGLLALNCIMIKIFQDQWWNLVNVVICGRWSLNKLFSKITCTNCTLGTKLGRIIIKVVLIWKCCKIEGGITVDWHKCVVCKIGLTVFLYHVYLRLTLASSLTLRKKNTRELASSLVHAIWSPSPASSIMSMGYIGLCNLQSFILRPPLIKTTWFCPKCHSVC